MNAARDFLNDVVEDLRERRLWPLAVLLALAIVVTPVALMKHGSETAAAPTQPPSSPPQPLKPLSALAKLDQVPKPSIRKLSAKDPFGGGHIPRLTSLADAAGAKGTGTQTASSGSSTGAGGGGGTTVSPVGGGTQGTPLQAFKTPSTKTVVYTFQVDAAFGDPQNPVEHRRLKRFSMLPDSTSPLLVFLGVDSSETRAVFLVDASLSVSGEGDCGDAACSFVQVGPGNEESFTDQQGHRYLLRVDQIRKVRLRRRARSSRHGARASASSDSATRSQDGGEAPRRFLSPLFGDRVEQTVQR